MGIASGVAGLVGGLSGLFGGSNMPTPPPSFQLPNQGAAANNAFAGIQGLQPFSNQGFNIQGTGQNIFNTLQANPYAGGFQQGANVAGGLGQSQAMGQYGIGGALTGLGFGYGNQIAGLGQQTAGLASPLVGGAQNVLNTSMDPQSQLYAYLQNQNLQQTQAIEQGAGLGTTPYGAGVEALSNQQFNMNWQNQQLGRQLAGLQGAQGALGQAGSLYGAGGGLIGAGGQLTGQLAGQGAGLQAAAPGQYYGASGLPYNTFQGMGSNQFGNLGQLAGLSQQGANLSNLPIQDYLSYLQTGNQSNATANQLYGLQLGAQQQGFAQNQALGAALGGGLYNVGRGMTGGLSSPFLGSIFGGGGNFGGYQSALGSMGASINPTTGFISS